MGDSRANVHGLLLLNLNVNRNGASIMERLPRRVQRVSGIRRESEGCVNYGTRNAYGGEYTFGARKRVTYPREVHAFLCRPGIAWLDSKIEEVQMMRVRVMKLKETSLAVAAAL